MKILMVDYDKDALIKLTSKFKNKFNLGLIYQYRFIQLFKLIFQVQI